MNKTLLETYETQSYKGHQYKINFWAGEVAEVQLVDHPANALVTLARATRGYLGNYEFSGVTEEEQKLFAEEIKKTKLAGSVEFLNYVFLIRDVPRSFTHQLVRTRIGASYVQQSTRFIGARDTYDILVPKTLHKGTVINSDYYEGNIRTIAAYEAMNETAGVHTQDARQMLPHGILTHIFWSVNMKTLQLVYNQRWCCCAEPSTWLPVMRQCKQLIIEADGQEIGNLLTAPIDRNESCGFNSKVLDKECAWRPRAPKFDDIVGVVADGR